MLGKVSEGAEKHGVLFKKEILLHTVSKVSI